MSGERRLRILVLSLIFPPDGVSTAQLVGEITEDLHGLGHEVTVLTAEPHYNIDPVARAQQPIEWHRTRLFGTSTFHGCRVLHVRMGAKAPGKIARSLQWLWFHTISFALSLRQRADVCLTVSPPPTLAVQCALRRALGGPRFVYAVWESYPDILFAMGLLKPGSPVGRGARILERWTYRRAASTIFLSQQMLDAARTREPRLESTGTVVPTFVDTELFAPMSRSTELRRELGLDEGRFVVGYAGNLGPAQDLSVVVEAVKRMGPDDVALVICGDGADRERLERIAGDSRHIFFTGHLPFVRMPEVYATFDVSLVPLAAGLSTEALPSKVYRSMACGVPLLAVTDPGSALDQLVDSAGCGLSVPPRIDAVRDAIASMTSAERDDWSQAARTAVVATASRKAVVERLEQILVTVADDG